MHLGLPEHWTIYDLSKDQGSTLAGLLALFAGVLAYRAGKQQAKAVQRQNSEALRIENRRLAREALAAANLLDGMLNTALSNINDLLILGPLEKNAIQTRLQPFAPNAMIDQIGRLGPETIDTVFTLRVGIARLRALKVDQAALLQELEDTKKIIIQLQEKVAKEISEANKVLQIGGGNRGSKASNWHWMRRSIMLAHRATRPTDM